MFLSTPGFLNRGVTCDNLNLIGNEPCDTDRLAKLEIISENTVAGFIRDVGMKSIEDDSLQDLFMGLRTSAGMTKENVSNGVPVNERLGILVG